MVNPRGHCKENISGFALLFKAETHQDLKMLGMYAGPYEHSMFMHKYVLRFLELAAQCHWDLLARLQI